MTNTTLREQKRADRAAAKAERTRAKELRKVTAALTRERRTLAMLERNLARREEARRWLPNTFPDWDQAQQNDSPLRLKGFVSVHDRQEFEKIWTALHANTFAKVYDALADAIACDKSEICLIEDRILTRKGQKVPVVYFRYTYNPAFNEVLKGAGRAVFDPRPKAWNLILDDGAKSTLAEFMGMFYRFVIDVSRMVIMRNDNEPFMAMKTRAAFSKLPFHVQVKRSDVLAAIEASRPMDEIREEHLYINDGSGFIACPEHQVFFTQSPFLLFRYAVVGGRPRYVSFSTLGNVAERVSFGNDDKRTAQAIARFMDTCRILQMPAFESGNAITEDANARRQLQGDFQRFARSLDTIRATIPDLGLAPLCSDYVSLVSQNCGADTEHANIIAYVVPGAAEGGYLNKIAAFFGHTEEDYPVVFTRSVLDTWDDQKDFQFLFIAAHELAHWLVHEMNGDLPEDDVHGMAWAICSDVLEYLFVGECSITSYRQYHSDELGTILGIEHVVEDVGIPALESIRAARTLSKNDIKDVVRDCLMALAVYLDAMQGDEQS